jgi:hypothetical protein
VSLAGREYAQADKHEKRATAQAAALCQTGSVRVAVERGTGPIPYLVTIEAFLM